MFQLRPYQQQAVDATLAHFRKKNTPAVIVLPTGAGKSLVIAELARLAKGKILVLTHVKELVEQNHLKFLAYQPELQNKAGVYAAGLKKRQTEQQVTFASVQSVAPNLQQFDANYSLVVVDECHRINDLSDSENTSQYGQIINKLKQANPQLKILGLTATPYRLGMGWIYRYHYHGMQRSEQDKPFETCIYELPIGFMIKHGYLTPPKLIDAPVAQYDFSSLESNAFGSYNEGEVNALLVKHPRVTQAIIEQVEELALERKGVMIFAATVKHAEEILGYLPKGTTALITAKTPATERETLITQFKSQQIKFLVNVAVLTTGFDAPHVDFIAILRPTESVSLYQQIVGRGLRLDEGKKDCLVIDYAGNGFDLYHPEVGEKKPNRNSDPVQVFCPACGFANTFWGKTDADGQVTEHYGRKCQGLLTNPEEDEVEACDYRFVFKECGNCGAENDIAARQCHKCEHQLVDPDQKLKDALNLKDGIVIRCAGVTLEAYKSGLRVIYHDEDGMELKEYFDFSHPKARASFNEIFGRRWADSTEPKEFSNANQVLSEAEKISQPDFVIARKQKHFFKVIERIFDYQGRFRTAD